MAKPQLPKLQQTVANTILVINISIVIFRGIIKKVIDSRYIDSFLIIGQIIVIDLRLT